MHQLEFMSVSEDGGILVGASRLINSPSWTGHILYFPHENDVVSGKINEIGNYSKYPLPFGIAAGTFLDVSTLLVGNDIGLIAMYGLDGGEKDNPNDPMTIYNKNSRNEHDRCVLSLSISKTTQKFLSSSMDHSVKIWDTETYAPEVSYDQAHTNYVTFVAFMKSEAGEENEFISASFDGSLLLWDRRKSTPAQVLVEERDYRPTHVEWFEDAEHLLFLGCDYGTIRLIDVRNPKDALFVHEFSNGRSVNTLRSFTRNSKKYLSVCGNTKSLKLYEWNDSLKEVYSNKTHNDYVRDTAWLSKTGVLLSCSWDSQIIKHDPFKLNESPSERGCSVS